MRGHSHKTGYNSYVLLLPPSFFFIHFGATHHLQMPEALSLTKLSPVPV
jgi:hypothetical protein